MATDNGNDDWASQSMAVAIGEIIRNEILFDVKKLRDVMSKIYDFFQTLERFFDTLLLSKSCFLPVTTP
ncbi:MAG: hypothetical protein RMX97_10365 [Nostoc sp. DedQUE11]|nr:hypothetical protein [Nostoc sp. DedQUE11]